MQATGHGWATVIDGAVLVTTRRMSGIAVDPVDRTPGSARECAGVR